MRIQHDKVSGALYMKLRDGEYDHTEDFSNGADVYLDVDAEGNVLGLESLSFEDLAQAIEERGGSLEVPERLGLGGRATDIDVTAIVGTGNSVRTAPTGARPEVGEIQEALSSLSRRDQELLRLRFSEGLPMDEAAARLGVDVSDARPLISAALKRLGELLKERRSGEVDVEELEELLARS